jgi:hypothetical protein
MFAGFDLQSTADPQKKQKGVQGVLADHILPFKKGFDVFQPGGGLVVINGQDSGANDEPAVPEDDFIKQRMFLVGLF